MTPASLWALITYVAVLARLLNVYQAVYFLAFLAGFTANEYSPNTSAQLYEVPGQPGRRE